MAKISISEASRRTGKPRSTLHRHIRTGKLSREFNELGNPIIDMSELERVYGHLLPPDMKPDGATLRFAPSNRTTLDIGVQIELEEALKRENVLLRDERDDLRRRLDGEADGRRRLTALLTDHRSKKRRSWWPWG
jgi:hypothetical protein